MRVKAPIVAPRAPFRSGEQWVDAPASAIQLAVNRWPGRVFFYIGAWKRSLTVLAAREHDGRVQVLTGRLGSLAREQWRDVPETREEDYLYAR